MNVIEVLNARYSARGYKSDPVSKEILEKILAAANRAPSARNTQPWEIYVAGGEPLERLRAAFKARTDEGARANSDIGRILAPAMIERIRAHAAASPGAAPTASPPPMPGSLFFGAPVVVFLGCQVLSPFSIFDLGLVAQSIMLGAKEYGLDTVPAGNFVLYPDLIRSELGVPEDVLLILGIALGYANEEAAARPRRDRRPLEEAVHFVGL